MAARGEPGADLVADAGLDDRWLRADSRARQMLERLDVSRLILLIGPPFAPEPIRAAARFLRRD